MSQRCQYRKSAGVIRSPYRRGLGGFGTKMTDSLGSTPQSSLPEGARGTEWRLLTKLFKKLSRACELPNKHCAA
jgi:hypothetical protein